jgi:hypothetical protein
MKKHHILMKKVCFLKKRPLFCYFFNQNAQKIPWFLRGEDLGFYVTQIFKSIKPRDILNLCI